MDLLAAATAAARALVVVLLWTNHLGQTTELLLCYNGKIVDVASRMFEETPEPPSEPEEKCGDSSSEKLRMRPSVLE